MPVKRWATTALGCIVMAAISGCLSTVQIRLNGELGHQLSSPLVAAFISFLGGTVCAWAVVFAMPRARRALVKLRTVQHARLLFTGGAYGAFYVAMTIVTGPIIGIAATTVTVVAGKVLGGLLIDRSRFFHHAPITLRRVIGATLAIVAVIVSQIGVPTKAWQPILLLLLCVSGMALSLQAAIQGSLSRQVGSLPLVTALSFSLGTLLLLGTLLGMGAGSAFDFPSLPAVWWLYTGGVLGVACVIIAAMVVPVIGVFRLVIATAAGQLVGSLLFDYFLPLGTGLRTPLIAAACITFAALWITRQSQTKNISPPADPALQ